MKYNWQQNDCDYLSHSSLGDMSPREYKDRFGEEYFPETMNIDNNFMNLALS
ncbi:hypothetical protein [Maribacter sp. 4G9]|uniref:hypothetical protein n=1 Tax=Maribacter sp. 4G9 TaxID=1889777 RepID=UPI0013FD5B25|nr:hypothetical protein [Maribacter sp. 4G9]